MFNAYILLLPVLAKILHTAFCVRVVIFGNFCVLRWMWTLILPYSHSSLFAICFGILQFSFRCCFSLPHLAHKDIFLYIFLLNLSFCPSHFCLQHNENPPLSQALGRDHFHLSPCNSLHFPHWFMVLNILYIKCPNIYVSSLSSTQSFHLFTCTHSLLLLLLGVDNGSYHVSEQTFSLLFLFVKGMDRCIMHLQRVCWVGKRRCDNKERGWIFSKHYPLS